MRKFPARKTDRILKIRQECLGTTPIFFMTQSENDQVQTLSEKNGWVRTPKMAQVFTQETPKESTMSEIVTTHLVSHQIDESRYKLFLSKSMGAERELNPHRKRQTTASPIHLISPSGILGGVEFLRIVKSKWPSPKKTKSKLCWKTAKSELAPDDRAHLRLFCPKIYKMENCTVRALPRWSPTRVLDTPMVA